MAKKNSNRKVKAKAVTKSNNWLFLLPVIVIAAVVPIVMKMVQVPILSDVIHLYPNEKGYIGDVFSYQKAVTLIWMAIVAVFFAIAYMLQKQKGFSYKFKNTESISMGVFVAFTLLSAIFSGMPTSWMGYPYRYEGVWVTLAYAVLFYCVMLIVDEEKTLRILTYAMCFSAFVIGVIGVFQYFDMDFFRTDLGKWVIFPDSTAEQREQISFNFGAKTIYSTLFNPNNVGSMMAMMAILFPTLGAFAHKIWQKVLYFALGGLSVCVLLGCNSRAGFVGAACGVAVAVVMCIVACRKNKKMLISALAQMLVCILLFISVWGMAVGVRNLEDSSQRLNLPNVDAKADAHVLDIQTYETSSMVHVNSGKIYFDFMQPDGDLEFTITDEDGNKMELHTDEDGNYRIKDERFDDITLQPNGKIVQITAAKEYPFILVYDDERGMEVVLSDNRRGKTDHDAEYIKILDEHRNLGSGRGYIWSRSIPLIKKTLIFGNGPDTFAVFFPQNEISAKVDIFNINYMLVDKPHSTYLQYAINNGCVALLGFLVCCGTALIRALRSANTAANGGTHTYTGYLVGAAGAVTGYLGAAMFNDSIVAVAPIFFILLGTLAVSARLAKNEAEQSATGK